MNSKVDFYFQKNTRWQTEINYMRSLALDCGLTEELKWGCPCYTHQGANVVLIHVFKEYCAFLFFKGALLKDTNNILIQQTANVQAQRQIRFTEATQIIKLKKVIKQYIHQAIEVEKAGLKVTLKKTTDFEMVEEFQNKLKKSKDLQKAFKALTPGRQRAYLLFFSSAKQSKTRETRIEKCIPDIIKGKGLNE